jgi:hypothetical protein
VLRESPHGAPTMTDRIQLLVKRISETRPVQSARRQALLADLRALRADIDAASAPEQAHSLDAALLLMEFMSRSEDVATAETLQIVASLVNTIEERSVRSSPARAATPPQATGPDVAQHQDLCLTQESLLGSILLQAGVISPESLGRALQLHSTSRLALGQCLVQLGAASAEQIAGAVNYQDQLREQVRDTRSETAPKAQPAAQQGQQAQQPTQAPTPRGDLRLSPKQRGFVQSMHSQVLGEVLIRLGSITREQLERALQLQRAANVHIGEALVQSGAVTWDQIKRALEVQRQLRRAS